MNLDDNRKLNLDDNRKYLLARFKYIAALSFAVSKFIHYDLEEFYEFNKLG